ncbi:MAG: DNA-methyltransferase [Candidatus Limnocylindrales bacterium]
MTAEAVLRSLPAGSIRVLITDPPYATVARSPNSAYLSHWFGGSLSWREIGRLLALARRKLAADGLAFVMTNEAGLEEAIEAMKAAGFVVPVRVIVWDKQAPGLGMGLRHQVEYVLLGRVAGSRTLAGTDLVSVGAVGPGTAGRYPTQKPDGLGRVLARMAGIRRGDLVVDPFCGSGALLVGAAERGATVVGSDISARAVALATRRLRSAVAARAPSLEGRRRPAEPASRNSARSTVRPIRRTSR